MHTLLAALLRPLFLALALAAPCVLEERAATPAPDARPNFVFVLGEGHGWSSTSVAMDGATKDARPPGATPALERLAQEGLRFSRFYASCPRCTPSRAAFLTGISPAKLHMTYVNERGVERRRRDDEDTAATPRVIAPEPRGELPDDVRTIADRLRAAGYATAHFGKWHVGRADPTSHGFDESDGANTNQGPERGVAPNPRQASVITERGIAFVKASVAAKKPFYLQLSHYGAGNEDEVTPQALARARELAPGLRSKELAELAGVLDMDMAIGRVLAALDELGIADHTYVIFSTDHGTPGGSRRNSANPPLRGGKGSLHEGGVRVPFLVRGPKVVAGKVCSVRTSALDLVPTLLELAQRPIEAAAKPDGLTAVEGGSLAPLLASGTGFVARPRAELVLHYPHDDLDNGGPASAIYVDDWKLLRNYETDAVELFDIVADPEESHDRAATEPKVVERLRAQLDAYLKAVDAQMPRPATAADGAGASSDPKPTTGGSDEDPPRKRRGGREKGDREERSDVR